MEHSNEIGFTVRRLSNAIRRDVEKAQESMGIKKLKGINGWAIGFFYENRERDVFQRDFEEKFSIRRSTASRMLKTMEQKGFIERISVENDARLKKIVLTEQAIENHKKIINNINEREKRLKNGISEAELQMFFSVMDKLIANMEGQND